MRFIDWWRNRKRTVVVALPGMAILSRGQAMQVLTAAQPIIMEGRCLYCGDLQPISSPVIMVHDPGCRAYKRFCTICDILRAGDIGKPEESEGL